MKHHRWMTSFLPLPIDLHTLIEDYAHLTFEFSSVNLVQVHPTKKPRKKRGRPRKGWFDFSLTIRCGFATGMEFLSPEMEYECPNQSVVCFPKRQCKINLDLMTQRIGYALKYHLRPVSAYQMTRNFRDNIWLASLIEMDDAKVQHCYWTDEDRALPHLFTEDTILCFYQTDDLQMFKDWFVTAIQLLNFQISGSYEPTESMFCVQKIQIV